MESVRRHFHRTRRTAVGSSEYSNTFNGRRTFLKVYVLLFYYVLLLPSIQIIELDRASLLPIDIKRESANDFRPIRSQKKTKKTRNGAGGWLL